MANPRIYLWIAVALLLWMNLVQWNRDYAERAAPAATVADALAKKGLAGGTRTFATVAGALEAARREAGPNDRIIVFGSFYTVAEALRSAR